VVEVSVGADDTELHEPARASASVAQDEACTRLRVAVEHAPGGVVLAELDGRIETANPAFCRMLGRSAASLQGRSLVELTYPDDAGFLDARLRTSAEGPIAGDLFELRLLHETGNTVWGAVRVHLVRGAAGAPLSLVLHVQDVTEQRHDQDLLHENEEKFRIAFEYAPSGMTIVRANGQYLSVNEAACSMVGYTREELLAGTLQRITHPDDVEKSNRWMKKVIAGDMSEPECEKRFIHRDGHVVWGVVRARWLREADGTPRFAVAHLQDITERKRVEEERARLHTQLTRAQKMEAIGHLAGGIAHDFNNLLTAIGGNASVVLADPAISPEVRTMLGEISQAVTSASNLTRQLLAFSRQEVIAPRVLHLNEVVLNLQRLLRRLLGEDLVLRTVLAPELGRVCMDPGQVEQILVNLAVNARDAMSDGGVLIMETSNVRLDEAFARGHPGVTPGDYALLAVSDDGCGMSEETRARLFEPFFTTKQPGKGTGLGLAMVYGAVKQNGGYIDVYSEPARGTTFKIYLPRVDAPAEAWGSPAPGEVRGGTETVLLVEDDPAVRAPAQRMLQHLGYSVHECGSGVEALAAAAALGGKVDLLVSDVVMPHMNGRELAERLTAAWPGVRVLFASGYTQNVIAHHGVLERGVEFLAKPYSLESLARRVREVLDHPR
jgi:PAS domain S-box-containing protein